MKVKLGEVFENVINGDWGDEPTGNNDVAVIRTTNFTNDGIINYNNVVCRQIKNDAVLKKKLIYGDIIIEKSGGSDNFPVGRVVYYDRIDEIYLCNNFTSILRVNKKLVDSKYLLYLMLNLYNKGVTTKFQNKTTGIRNLQLTSYLANTEINIHDIQTQKEIVAVLDKVTSLISMRKEQLDKLDILVKSKFIEMFGDPMLNPKGWEKKKLGEVCDQIRGITYKSQDVEESLNSNSIMLLRANNISNDGTINYDNIIFINKNKVNSIQFIKRNDILVCASSGSVHLVGKAAQIKEYKLLTFGAFCKVVRPKNINPIYIGQFFQSAYYRKTISTLAQGANINNIRNEDIDNITIPIPPLDLQNQFAEFVEQVEKNKENIESSLNQLETLYSALMQEYFG